MSDIYKRPGSSLLDTILADSVLMQRAMESQSLSMTVTLEIDANGQRRIDHPEWRDSRDASTVMDGAAVDLRVAEGFVPARSMVGPGKRPAEDTEYRLVGQLGSGGTGVVYQAHQRAIDREVAVKVLRDELADDVVARQRFLLEARTIGSLDHPNVIALHELGTGPSGELFYSMKRIDGTSWDRTIDEMSLEENLETLLRLCDAIRYAHSRELIHRDIKPENVMLGRFGEVLLADWGLALSLSGHGSGRAHAIGGTPAYMAPELAAGDASAQSIRTDIYLLGALLYRILTGHPPHYGETLLECIRRAAANQIRKTSLRGGWIDVAMQAMATRADDRYPDVAAFAEALAREKKHERSVDLLRRADRLVQKVGPAAKHQDYSVAETLIREALDVWPGNQQAAETLVKLQTEHARTAAAAGDYDLALDLLAQAGQGDSELAARVGIKRDSRREQAVRESKFSQLFTQSPDAGLMTRWDDGEIIEANKMFEQLTGYEPTAVVGKKIFDLNLWATHERRAEFIEQLSVSGHLVDFETPMLRRDGSWLDVSLCASKVELAGEPFILTTMRDISPRIIAQRELKHSRQRLRDMQRLAQLGTWELDVASGKVHWSDETLQIAGLPVEHGAPNLAEYLKTVHPNDRGRLSDAINSAIQDRAAYELRIRHLLRDGSWNTVIARGQPNLDKDGHVIEVYGVMIDITRYTRN
jgi:PAS domain S-box-containing protein